MTLITIVFTVLQIVLKKYNKEISVAFFSYEAVCVNVPLLVGYGFTFRQLKQYHLHLIEY